MIKSILLHAHALLFAIMLSMLYYLLPFLGVSQFVFFVALYFVVFFSCVVSGSLFKRFDHLEYLIFLIIFFSLILYIINGNFYTKPFFNDLIRLLCFFLFLRYLKSLQLFDKKLFFKIFTTYSILFLLLVLYFEFNFQSEFRLLLAILFDSEYNVNGVNTRLAGLIGDSNALSFLLIILIVIFSDSNYKLFLKVFVSILVIVAIILTGSRMGLLMLILLFFRYFGFFRSILFYSLFLLIFFFLLEPIEFRDGSDSDNDRMDSIISGWNYLLNSDFILPLGNILYKNNYLNLSTGSHYPHLGVLYLLTEYGLFFLPIFILLFFIYRRMFYSDFYLCLILILALFLLPNQIYYFTFYLAFSYNIEKTTN